MPAFSASLAERNAAFLLSY
jgi:hypothetical protein